MSRKKNCSNELKLEIVQIYFEGNIGLKELIGIYHVNKSNIQKWKAIYAEHGVESYVQPMGHIKIYVVEYMHNTGVSMRQTAAHFNIPSIKSVSDWNRIYLNEGRETLYEERREKSRKMGMKK